MSKTDLKNSNLLIVDYLFPYQGIIGDNFVKYQLDYIKNHFNKVFVISFKPYFPRFLSRFNIFPRNWREKPLLRNYEYDNVSVYYIPHFYLPVNKIMWNKAVLAYPRTMETIKKLKLDFDIIHAHFTNPSGYIAYRVSKEFNRKYFLTVHENSEWLKQEIAQDKRLFKETWGNAASLIRVNRKDISLLKPFNQHSIPIPNGYEHKKFKKMDKLECRNILRLPRDKNILINVGFYVGKKGQKYLIDALAELPDKIRSNILCLIVGGGSLEKTLQKRIEDRGLTKQIRLSGRIGHNELPLWLNASDIFCLPSLSEGNPTVMFEAMSCGLPFVGTNAGGIPEVIINEKLGLLCGPADAASLAKNIKIALETKWDTDYILDYSKEFTWEKIAEQIVELYRQQLLT